MSQGAHSSNLHPLNPDFLAWAKLSFGADKAIPFWDPSCYGGLIQANLHLVNRHLHALADILVVLRPLLQTRPFLLVTLCVLCYVYTFMTFWDRCTSTDIQFGATGALFKQFYTWLIEGPMPWQTSLLVKPLLLGADKAVTAQDCPDMHVQCCRNLISMPSKTG